MSLIIRIFNVNKSMDNDNSIELFLKQHFDFDSLKEIGFYGKDVKRKDYQKQADRICCYFSLNSIFDWLTMGKPKCHVTYVASIFSCPACTCEQQIPDGNKGQFKFKCAGCKRQLSASLLTAGWAITEAGGFKEETATYLTKSEQEFIYKPQ